MKVLGVAFLLVLLLAVGVFVYVGYNTNSIVKNATETIGTQYLGAPVTVKDVEIALQEGRGTLKELDIGNPHGYAGAYDDIGRASNGVDAATVLAQVLEPITKAVTRKLTDTAKKGLGVDPNQFESEAARRMRDTLKSLGHPTN
jgi:hypothetical protein